MLSSPIGSSPSDRSIDSTTLAPVRGSTHARRRTSSSSHALVVSQIDDPVGLPTAEVDADPAVVERRDREGPASPATGGVPRGGLPAEVAVSERQVRGAPRRSLRAQRFSHRCREQRTDTRRQRPRRLLRPGAPRNHSHDHPTSASSSSGTCSGTPTAVGRREALLTQRPPQQQLGEEHHAGGVGAVGSHAAHREDDHRRRVGGRDQLADEPVSGRYASVSASPAIGADATSCNGWVGSIPCHSPSAAECGSDTTTTPRSQSSNRSASNHVRSAAAGLDAGDEIGAHLTGVDGRRPRRAVQPALAGIPTDLPLHLAQQRRRCAGRPVEAGIVRTPRDHPAHTRSARVRSTYGVSNTTALGATSLKNGPKRGPPARPRRSRDRTRPRTRAGRPARTAPTRTAPSPGRCAGRRPGRGARTRRCADGRRARAARPAP